LQANESSLIQNLRQRDEKINHLNTKIAKQSEEIVSLRDKGTSASLTEQELFDLKERFNILELTLQKTMIERDETVRRVKIESRSHKLIIEELERSREEVLRYKNALNSLNEELDQRQQDAVKAQERIFKMESTLHAFKKETRQRVNTFTERDRDSSSVLEQTRRENRGLTSNLHSLNEKVEKLRRERDICFQSLQEGQKKLSALSSKNPTLQLYDVLPTSPNQRASTRSREPRTATRSSRPPVESVTARGSSRIPITFPELYVTNYDLGSPTTLAEERAEEIVACVAQSAKHSLEENFEEVSQLRSQIYRLEDERSEQVSVLKAKVRKLENELSRERVGNQTPLMGTSARRARGQNYFVDYDEKHWDEKIPY